MECRGSGGIRVGNQTPCAQVLRVQRDVRSQRPCRTTLRDLEKCGQENRIPDAEGLVRARIGQFERVRSFLTGSLEPAVGATITGDAT